MSRPCLDTANEQINFENNLTNMETHLLSEMWQATVGQLQQFNCEIQSLSNNSCSYYNHYKCGMILSIIYVSFTSTLLRRPSSSCLLGYQNCIPAPTIDECLMVFS